MRRLSALFVVALALASSRSASADAPPLVPVQGYLTDSSGSPLHGNFNIRFRLYGAASGGTPLFEEYPAVTVDHGRFVHYLGTEEPLDLALVRDHATLYLGVRIGNDPEATPLVELASVPYAAFAQFCGDANTIGGQSTAQLHDYGSLTNVPSTFPPSAHSHSYTSLTNVPSAFPPSAHTHAVADVTGAQAVLANACAPGSSIRAIDPSGAVTCETDDDVPYTSGVGIVVNPDRSLSLDDSVVRAACFDTEAELRAVLGDDYAPLVHTHAATDITGPITASQVTYASPQTRRLQVGASEFMLDPYASSPSWAIPKTPYETTLAPNQFNAVGVLRAPIRLPQFARLVSVTCLYLDTDSTNDFARVGIAVHEHVNFFYTSGDVIATSGGNATTTYQGQASVSVNASVMFQDTRAYSLAFQFASKTDNTTVNGRFHGCTVVYTVTTPD